MNRVESLEPATARNVQALALASRVIQNPRPDKDAVLLVSPAEARLLDDPIVLIAHLRGTAPSAVLLLPVGAWALELLHTLGDDSAPRWR